MSYNSIFQAKQLALIGGVGVNDTCRRIMRHLMTHDLLTAFSLTGRKKTKQSFKNTVLYDVVRQSARLSLKLSVDDKAIELGIMEVFKHATDRLKKLNNTN